VYSAIIRRHSRKVLILKWNIGERRKSHQAEQFCSPTLSILILIRVQFKSFLKKIPMGLIGLQNIEHFFWTKYIYLFVYYYMPFTKQWHWMCFYLCNYFLEHRDYLI
jgi:hypothetical protein